jgi:hypothetical protein
MNTKDIVKIMSYRLRRARGLGFEIFFPHKKIVSFSIPTLFSAVEELGDDLRFLGRIGAPSLLVKEIIISGL